ncbi:hypothetical protein L3Y34_010371 [Caenorhabditis briggsae]|uniref:Ubiquitin-like protease family profile domain-containing protein n=1 Tax=Caenorhabditis briggsae TaxID=6238 RepID=A0AAE8ZRE1_CAEBR|nr:hypothetical protein L3Y34_010371 [Caenorhabditis briggsae]
MLHREPRLQPDKKRRDDTKEIFDELKELLRIPRPTKIRLLEEIARRWEIIDEIKIDSKFCADKQITVALEPLAEHIRRQVEYEFDLSTKLKKLEAILIVLKSELNGEVIRRPAMVQKLQIGERHLCPPSTSLPEENREAQVTTNASNISSSNQSITPNSHSLAENQPPPSIEYSDWNLPTNSEVRRNKPNPSFSWNSTPQNTQMTTDLISTSQFQVQQKLIKQPGFLDAKRSQRKELNNQNLSSLSICLSNPPVNNPFNQEIRFCDLIHLQPERWLNEYLIEFSIDRLASEYLNPDQQKTVHLFDTTFFRRRAEEIVTAVPRKSREEMAESMKKMCIEKQERKRKIPIFERDLLVFPINHSHHWILCVVINPKGAIVEEGKDKNNNKCRIIVFDSIDCTVRKKDVVMFMTIYMRQQFERVWKLNGVLQEDRIEIPEVKHPYKQLNEYDCGVYTILFARSIICNYIQFQKAQNEHQFDLCKFDRNARNADSINLRTAMLNWFLELVDEEFCPELNMDTLIKIAPGYRDIIKTKPMY